MLGDGLARADRCALIIASFLLAERRLVCSVKQQRKKLATSDVHVNSSELSKMWKINIVLWLLHVAQDHPRSSINFSCLPSLSKNFKHSRSTHDPGDVSSLERAHARY
ncbi:hypothetical protein BDW71DRAFT_89686 [Aspergillus fruticulosus]